MKPNTVKKLFFSVLSGTEDNISSFVNNPGTDMTRHRWCDFTDTVLATLSFSMNRSNTELLNYFGIRHPHIPSKSALTQQRNKFNDRLFPHLLSSFNEAVPFRRTYKGFHLIAVDGSDINLPTDRHDTVYRIKQARSDSYYYQMHLNALYDICENRYVSALVQPRPQMDERKAFQQLISGCPLPENTIFIADRGYVSLNTIAFLQENRKYFLIRAKAPDSPNSFFKDLLEPDVEDDRICSIGVSRSRKRFRGTAFDKKTLLRHDRKFDYIPPDDTDSVYAMKIRITCIRLESGSLECLISNLPVDAFPPSALKELYWKRWSIETSFRSLKYALALTYLHSVSRKLIIQEIYAKMIMYNFTSLIHAYAERCRRKRKRSEREKHPHRVSFDDAVPICRLFLRERLGNEKIKTLLLKHLTAVKVSAASARHMRSQTVKPLNNRA